MWVGAGYSERPGSKVRALTNRIDHGVQWRAADIGCAPFIECEDVSFYRFAKGAEVNQGIVSSPYHF